MGIGKRDTATTRRRSAAGVLASIGLAASLLPPAGADVPAWIAGEKTAETGMPLWVAAEEGAPGGVLREELFAEGQIDWIREHLETARENRESARRQGLDRGRPCLTEATFPHGSKGPPRGDTPGEILEHSSFAVVGTITDRRQGFYAGTPATLLELRVDQTLKWPETARLQTFLYVYYPASHVEIEGEQLCVGDLHRDVPPTVDAVMVLLSDVDPATEPGTIVRPVDNDLFFTRPDRTLSVPEDYPTREISLEDLLGALTAAKNDLEAKR